MLLFVQPSGHQLVATQREREIPRVEWERQLCKQAIEVSVLLLAQPSPVTRQVSRTDGQESPISSTALILSPQKANAADRSSFAANLSSVRRFSIILSGWLFTQTAICEPTNCLFPAHTHLSSKMDGERQTDRAGLRRRQFARPKVRAQHVAISLSQ